MSREREKARDFAWAIVALLLLAVAAGAAWRLFTWVAGL